MKYLLCFFPFFFLVLLYTFFIMLKNYEYENQIAGSLATPAAQPQVKKNRKQKTKTNKKVCVKSCACNAKLKN